jgi:hypothetical protein
VGWKLCLLLLDLGVMALLWLTLTHFDQPPWKLALYAWSPLVIKEGVGTGHADALVAFMLLGLTLALARARPVAIGIWLAAATLTGMRGKPRRSGRGRIAQTAKPSKRSS